MEKKRVLTGIFMEWYTKRYEQGASKISNAMVKNKNITIDGLASMVARGFSDMGERFDRLEREFRTDISGLKTDVAELKTDVAELKTDVAELQTGVAELQTDMTRLEVTVNRIDTRTQNQVDSVYEDTTALKTDVKEMKKDIVGIKAHVGMTA